MQDKPSTMSKWTRAFGRAQRQCFLSLSNSNQKPFYITTPIFYVNAAPHLGHLYSMVLCDVRNRWERLNERTSYFTTGTDEHGLKVQAAAEKKGMPLKEFVDSLVPSFKALASAAHVSCDRFIRTTDSDHVAAVNWFWKTVQEKGYIYEGQHSGWYSVSDETFYPESQIQKLGDKMVSIETRTEVTFQSEKNYFFKLSAFYEDLLAHLKKNPTFILPSSKQAALMTELTNNGKLEDLSISRPSLRLKWGIPVPGDSTQTIYVWFDALVNYLTSSGYPWKDSANTVWPATHLIGKDIVRFHGIFWPCFLMAADIELPQQLVVHGHWLCEGTKMSKSLGNVVDPIAMIERYGADPVRLFLCENSVLEGDGDFSEKLLYYSRNNVVGKLANLIMRCCGPKFNVKRATEKSQNGSLGHEVLDSFENPELTKLYDFLVQSTNECVTKVGTYMDKYEMVKVTETIWNLVDNANLLVQMGEPWRRDEDQQDIIIHAALEAARVASILLTPIMPELSQKLLDRFAVAPDYRVARYAKFGGVVYGDGANRKGDAPMKRIERSFD